MSDIKIHLDKARAEFEQVDNQFTDITRKREIALVKLQTLEMVAGADGMDTEPEARAARRAPGAAQRVTPRGNAGRAAPGSWKAAIASLISRGLSQFSYQDVMQAAKDLALDAPMPSVRVRVSKFKNQGYLEPVTDKPGVYRATKDGREFFK